MAPLDGSETIFQPRAERSIPRQTLGGLSLLLVVALTLGAARSGALVSATRDGGFERAAAVMPRTVHEAQRRCQRERTDVRPASEASGGRVAAHAMPLPALGETIEPVRPLRAALIDLPPPARG